MLCARASIWKKADVLMLLGVMKPERFPDGVREEMAFMRAFGDAVHRTKKWFM